jgi:hypothetical protein
MRVDGRRRESRGVSRVCRVRDGENGRDGERTPAQRFWWRATAQEEAEEGRHLSTLMQVRYER